MNEVNLAILRQVVASESSPYKMVRRDAVEYVGRLNDGSEISAPYEGFGKNVYRVEGNLLLMNDFVSRQLDEMVGLSRKQAKIVRNASGEAGIRDFRNFLASACSITNPVSVALIANPSSKTVSGLVPIAGEEPICSEAFFDFVELFMDKTRLHPTRYEMAYDINTGITLFFDSDNPDVRQIAPGEDFLTNSYFLKWNLGQIELGRYYERLVCSNGQMETIRHSEARITSLRKDEVVKLMDIPRSKELLDSSFRQFSAKALESMEVRASMAELKLVSEKLNIYLVEKQSARAIAPFSDELLQYKEAGYECTKEQLRKMKASMSVWKLYNSVTDYASNNPVWSEDDNRRGMLQGEAFKFLMRERDIRNYTDIFA